MYRPDSTAWAVLALARNNKHSHLVESGRAILASTQWIDGRITFPDFKDVYWPTAISVLAWHGALQFDKAKKSAEKFLLESTGRHFPKQSNAPSVHDTSIKGWPWIGQTHSFVEPTAMTLLSLDICGYGNHPRFHEGIKMILDRQLPHGGWNYGNTIVYGNELRPFMETTGIAIAALARHAEISKVSVSLHYLKEQIEQSRTPLALAWALLGLGAWGEFPNAGLDWIEQTLKKQSRYGPYGTSLLAILALAYSSRGEFQKIFM
jgi:hypothetical protein